MKPVARHINNNLQIRYVLLGLGFTVSLLAALYMYLLSVSVVHVVMSKETEENIYRVHSEIADLEAEYMERQNAIAEKIIAQNGYEAAPKIFIDKNPTSVVTKR